mmetsp:Transcript_14983/g.49136  ORF Transcript_14983/g.49136 Transcript_14983/m.49136 type:complete len:94 (-) Transcript_14983:112-393(-)
MEDSYFNNAYYAKVGGIPTEELNQLELELLWRLDFRLFVSPQEMREFIGRLTPPPPPLPSPAAPGMVRSVSSSSLASMSDAGSGGSGAGPMDM